MVASIEFLLPLAREPCRTQFHDGTSCVCETMENCRTASSPCPLERFAHRFGEFRETEIENFTKHRSDHDIGGFRSRCTMPAECAADKPQLSEWNISGIDERKTTLFNEVWSVSPAPIPYDVVGLTGTGDLVNGDDIGMIERGRGTSLLKETESLSLWRPMDWFIYNHVLTAERSKTLTATSRPSTLSRVYIPLPSRFAQLLENFVVRYVCQRVTLMIGIMLGAVRP